MGDPDLFYARLSNSKIEGLLTSLQNKYKPSLTGHQVFSGGGAGCLDGNTNIALSDGSKKPIYQIKCGDFVLSETINGGRAISRVWRTMCLWEYSGVKINNKITVSSTQPILCSKGWKLADMLTLDDLIIGPGRKHIPVQNIEKWSGKRNVYHLKLNGYPFFIAEDMIFHNILK